MTHPASIFPISALAVAAILLLSSCSDSRPSDVNSVRHPDWVVAKSVHSLMMEIANAEPLSSNRVILNVNT
ncbi:MAG: hypothetical protein AAF810_21975 [Cyanobacteria bacterium P01_D01_bin.36]